MSLLPQTQFECRLDINVTINVQQKCYSSKIRNQTKHTKRQAPGAGSDQGGRQGAHWCRSRRRSFRSSRNLSGLDAGLSERREGRNGAMRKPGFNRRSGARERINDITFIGFQWTLSHLAGLRWCQEGMSLSEMVSKLNIF